MSAATRPTPARILVNASAPDSSAESSTVERVGLCVAAAEVGESGFVGGVSATVAFGRPTVGAPPLRGAFAVFKATVGAPIGAFVVASLIVGAPAVMGRGAAVLSGIVGAGAGAFGARGAPPATGGLGALGVGGGTGAAEGAGGVGGLTGGEGGAIGAGEGRVAEGTEGGASAAFNVTRTVSFFSGMLEVCLDGVLFSGSLMRRGFWLGGYSSRFFPGVSNTHPVICFRSAGLAGCPPRV